MSRLALRWLGSLVVLTLGCGSAAPADPPSLVSAQSADFVLRDPTYSGSIARRTGTNAEGAAYTYAGEYDRTYTRDEDFDTDVAELTEGLPAIDGTYRIFSTHSNALGSNLFANPAAMNPGDVVIYNACEAAAAEWATQQARATRVVVYATDGKVAGGRSDGTWFKYLPNGTRTEELPPGTNYAGDTVAAAAGLVPHA